MLATVYIDDRVILLCMKIMLDIVLMSMLLCVFCLKSILLVVAYILRFLLHFLPFWKCLFLEILLFIEIVLKKKKYGLF